MRHWPPKQRPATTEYLSPPREIRDNTKARRAWLAEKLAEVTAQGRIAKITGTGSYQQISMKIVKETKFKEQLRGLCQYCCRAIAVINGVLAHHGYERPGDGYQTQSCIGARELPLSESCTITRLAHGSLGAQIVRLEAQLAAPQEITEVVFKVSERDAKRDFDGKTLLTVTEENAVVLLGKLQRHVFSPNHSPWARAVLVQIARWESELTLIRGEHERLAGVITQYEAGALVNTTKLYTVEV